MPLGAEDDLATVEGVGRLLRLLRAARLRAPAEPYAMVADPEDAAALLRRCVGTTVLLHVAVRRRRDLALWTETGVERLGDVIDFGEDEAGLWVRRRGGQGLLHIPRRNLIRYSATSSQLLQVASVEPLPQTRLRRVDRSGLS